MNFDFALVELLHQLHQLHQLPYLVGNPHCITLNIMSSKVFLSRKKIKLRGSIKHNVIKVFFYQEKE